MNTTQSDLVESYKLETEFFQDHIRHTRYVEKERNRYVRKKENWCNCEELGTGGLSVVYKQVRGTTSRYRAVKTIDKRRLPSNLDYSRELLVMAILAKRPDLFVKFLGWYEKPETLYIAMEYLSEGDLTKYIGSPLPQETVQTISKQILEGLKVMHQKGIAHRDLKPANIFVVSTSPFRVKLGDFGISKRIRPQDTTTLHTEVSTRIYGAPEVLGSDPNSETSVYTNAVDIWSLGCVIYELLAGTRLFASETQVSHYYHEISPFPEDKLKRLSPPTDDAGILLLKSMLAIQPGYRPTVEKVLGNAWLVGLKSDNEDSGDDHDETAQSGDESSWGREIEGKLTTHRKRKKRGQSPITQGDSKYAPGDVALGANPRSQSGSDPTTLKFKIGTAMVIPPDVASAESSLIQKGSMNSGLAVDASQLPGDSFQSPQGAEETKDRQYSTIVSPKPPTSCHPTPDPRHGSGPQLAPATNAHAGHTLKTVRKPQRVKPSKIPRPMPVVGDASRGWGGLTANPMKNPNTQQNPNTERNPDQNPNTRPNPNQNPNAVSNHNWNSNTSPNPNRNSNVGWKLRTGGAVLGWNPNAGGNPNIGPDPNAGGNPNIGPDPNAGGNRNLGLNRNRLVAEPNSG